MTDIQRVRGWMNVVLAVAVRPGLWSTAIGVVRSHSTARGERALWPKLAHPYLEFRLQTQYGSRDGLTTLDSRDVLEYLGWVKSWRALR